MFANGRDRCETNGDRIRCAKSNSSVYSDRHYGFEPARYRCGYLVTSIYR